MPGEPSDPTSDLTRGRAPGPDPVAVPRPAAATGLGALLADRWRTWRDDPRAGAVALAILALSAGVVWYHLSTGGSAEGTAVPSTTAAGATPTTTTLAADEEASPVVVHVAGAVTRPGVVELAAGARVADALAAVGGATPDADVDRLNLAAKLSDGQRVAVPQIGEVAPPAPVGGASGTSGEAGAASGPVDLNVATLADLEELPGVGPVLAQAIVDERERRGGFRSVQELLDVRGIGDARFADLKDLVTV